MAEVNAATLGAFLVSHDNKRVRRSAKGEYEFFPQREHIEQEFDLIWKAQSQYHPTLMTEEARMTLRGILLFQRPLKTVATRKCPYFPLEEVLAQAHPLYQELALRSRVNDLQVVAPGYPARPLNREQRNIAAAVLRSCKRCSLDALAVRLPGLENADRLHASRSERRGISGDPVRAVLADRACFGTTWLNFTAMRQWDIIQRLNEEEDADALHDFLVGSCGLDMAHAVTTAKVRLPQGDAHIGETAAHLVLAHLEFDAIDIDTAIVRAGLRARPDASLSRGNRLPYYGRVLREHMQHPVAPPGDIEERECGRIANPTMHIAWRQVQKLVNAIIDRHGLPDRIVAELAPQLKQGSLQNERRRKRGAAARAIGSTLEKAGIPNIGLHRAKLRLWEELNPGDTSRPECPYCGVPIPFDALFTGDTVIDRIVPFSLTMDDSNSNRLLVHSSCRASKGNASPFEAWGSDTALWSEILTRAARLPTGKMLRFSPDATTRFGANEGGAWRLLTDDHFLSKLTRRYLRSLFPPTEYDAVHVTSGRLSGLLMGIWRLNDLRLTSAGSDTSLVVSTPQGCDYREKAAVAAVLASLSDNLFQEVAGAAQRAEKLNVERVLVDMPPPWAGYRDDLRKKLRGVVASHKPDHGSVGKSTANSGMTAGRLHNETAYGVTDLLSEDGKTPMVVHRVPISKLQPEDVLHPRKIRDRALRNTIQEATQGLTGTDFREALIVLSKEDGPFHGMRRVRVHVPINVIPIRDRVGRIYKSYKADANARWELWRSPDGALTTQVITQYEAHRSCPSVRPHPAAKMIIKLYKNDIVAADPMEGCSQIFRVVRISRDGRLTLAGINEAGNLRQRHKASDDQDVFRYLDIWGKSAVKMQIRQLRVDLLGRIFDPGPAN